MAVFAAVAAVGFVAAYAGPLGVTLTRASAEAQPLPVTLYASALDDSQSYAAGYAAGREAAAKAEAAAMDLGRDSYEVYVTPKPTPTPEPVPEPEETSSSDESSSSEPVAAARPYYTGGGSSSEWMSAAGIAEGDWGYVDYIVSRESGWNPNATNSSSGACGLVQALPCSKVPGNGYDPVDNLRWGNGYAVGRYGSWASAYAFWTSNHWW